MICPFCGNDFRDVPANRENSGFYHGDDHYLKRYRRYGYRCGNCNEIVEIIAQPTGKRYLKRKETIARHKNQGELFGDRKV